MLMCQVKVCRNIQKLNKNIQSWGQGLTGFSAYTAAQMLQGILCS